MQGVLFARILHMSLIGCYSVLVVLLVRLLLTRLKCERKYAYYLWLAVFLNLSVPISLSGFFSLIPGRLTEFTVEEVLRDGQDAQTQELYEEQEYQQINVFPAGDMVSAGAGNAALNTGAASELPGAEKAKTGWKELLLNRQVQARILSMAEVVWLMGILCFLACSLASVSRLAWRLSRGTRTNIEGQKDIVEMEELPSPFLWGFFHPVIYLPSDMEEGEQRYIIAHERYHRVRRDHLVKILFFGVTVLHWFNPFAWLAYGLCCKDMEISCDEAVLAGSRKNIRKAYAQSILKYAAKQNGFIITPLTFGEPSVKSRIRNVLRYRKRSAALSAVAILCVAGAAAGLFFRPSGTDARAAEPESSMQDAPEADSNLPEEDKTPTEVVNNGGEVIRVGEELYYIAGQKLYSDGQKLYASLPYEDGSWDTYAYELDGSGFRQVTEGRIVGCDEETMELWILEEEGENEELQPGLYILGDLNLIPILADVGNCLGIYGEYAYFERSQDGKLYVDRVWKGDGTTEENLLGQGIAAQMFTDFQADDEYLLLAAGEMQGSLGMFDGSFYSYVSQPGDLREEHLTDASGFALAGEYIYYQKYDNQGNGGNELYRAARDLKQEEQVGEGLTFLKYDESTDTILAAKADSGGSFLRLVRVRPDGSEEQTLFDPGAADPGSGGPYGTEAEWIMEPGDKMRFSEVSLLGDIICVKAEQWGYREGSDVGWRDSLIRTGYFQIQADGSGFKSWDPERSGADSGDYGYLTDLVVGEPCDPDASGWNLADIKDVRGSFARMSYIPEEGTENDTLLLGAEENYTLYGKGDYESMLLVNGGSFSEIRCPYGSNYMILPELMEFDYDGDGMEEAAIRLNIKHGTGIYVDTFLMADQDAAGDLYVYQFTPEDFEAQLMEKLTWQRTGDGLRAYVAGQAAGEAMADDAQYGAWERVSVGDQIRFPYGDCRIRISAALEFWTDDSTQVIPGYNGYNMQAEVVYEDGGYFSLRDFEARDGELDQAIISVVESERQGTAIRFEEINYDLEKWNGGILSAEVKVYPVGSETYDYADLEVERIPEGQGAFWVVQRLAWRRPSWRS